VGPAIPDLAWGGDPRRDAPRAGAGPSADAFGDDDPFDAPAPDGALELDLPVRSAPPAPPAPPEEVPAAAAAEPPPPASAPAAPPPPPPGPAAPPPPPEPAVILARYPSPPEKIWQAPLYTLRVLWRQLELRQDLAALRRGRSPDVRLYERALEVHDKRVFAIGLAVDVAVLVIATVLFFLPVILRFTHGPE
jgi:hypothetical protein